MIVKSFHGENGDGLSTLEIEVDGKNVVSIYPLCECPEDAILERDLGFAYRIPKLMYEAFLAGKRGEKFETSAEKLPDGTI